MDATAADRLVEYLAYALWRGAPAPPTGASAVEWDAVLQEAGRHRVAPLLYRCVRDRAPAAVPPDVLARLRASYELSRVRTAIARRQLGELLVAWASRGIPAIVLKGAHLGEAVYADAAVRPMSDVDVMVRPADRAAAAAALGELGYVQLAPKPSDPDYTSHHHLPPFVRRDGVPVEVHTALVDARAPFRIPSEDLWARSVPTRIAGVDALALAPDDALLHLAVHAAYGHRFAMPLLAVCDVAALLVCEGPRLDWARLMATANAAGAGPVLFCTLGLTTDVLGVPVPHDVLERLTHDRVDRDVVAAARGLVLASAEHLPSGVEDVFAATGHREKIRAFARALFPPPAELRRIYRRPGSRAVYSDYFVYWHYLARPLAVLARRGRLAVELLVGTERRRPARDHARRQAAIAQWLSTFPRPAIRRANRA